VICMDEKPFQLLGEVREPILVSIIKKWSTKVPGKITARSLENVPPKPLERAEFTKLAA